MYKSDLIPESHCDDALVSMDTTAGLWLEIDQLHLKYLTHDDNVEKVGISRFLNLRSLWENVLFWFIIL